MIRWLWVQNVYTYYRQQWYVHFNMEVVSIACGLSETKSYHAGMLKDVMKIRMR